MRVFHSSKYHYAGKVNGFHVFESNHKDLLDKEFVIVERAKLINSDGSYKYYDVDVEVADSHDNVLSRVNRFKLYSEAIELVQRKSNLKSNYSAKSIEDSVQRVCLTQASKPTHIPKRRDAGDDSPVSTIKVNRRKLVSADA